MKEGYIKRAAWAPFVESLARRCQVYAPCEEGETVRFRQIREGDPVCLDHPAHGAPKGVIFPQSETLFTFTFSKDPDEPQKTRVSLDAEPARSHAVILAGRPCDARGFTILDRVFLEADPYYRERRERTTIITLACNRCFSGCFCASVGGGPADKTGSDALVTELEHGYYIEVLTEKGADKLADSGMEDGAAYRDEAKKRQDGAINGAGVYTKVRPELSASDEFWQETAEKCLSCGACTYLCPTCQCFNITDEQGITTGERIRSWDSCMFSHFTLEASGHNPRSRKSQRLKNRVEHKFIWYPEVHGEPACTGCGRCIRHCPASVDISRIVTLLSGREETHDAA
jgi:ferredoxin